MTPKIERVGPGYMLTLSSVQPHLLELGEPKPAEEGCRDVVLMLTDDDRRELLAVLRGSPT